ncbi:hypothetical protein SAMN05216226_10946 [Halovenus aranensis]|uniref:Uncharacterized protein n=1 Tax=Halovenus aranensis TaxID=890420 RepID=A0A1G8WKK5_9EURY|nr:hypothetical protein [Halovenus aranensis]SDJ78130.1 hypothetical protein SAMN05216226_10946 [Halovenus aranensis]
MVQNEEGNWRLETDIDLPLTVTVTGTMTAETTQPRPTMPESSGSAETAPRACPM